MAADLPTPTILSIKSDGLKASDEITVVYKTSFNLPAYLTVCLVLNNEICLSLTQLKKSPDLFDWNYIYETKARLDNYVDPGTRCYLMIFDNFFRICGFYHIEDLQDPIEAMSAEVKCTNCGTMETPVWRFSENRNKICNACHMYYRKYKSNRPVEIRNGKISIIRKERESKSRKEICSNCRTLACSERLY